MRLTTEHIQAFGYWRTPASLRARAPKMRPPDLDWLINAHAGLRRDTDNALQLLRMRLRNRDTAYTALEPSAWDRVNAPKRYWAFTRWRRALVKSQSIAFLREIGL